MKRTKNYDVIVGVKLADALVKTIDREAMVEGLTRSAIIRRVLKRTFEPMPVTVHS